MGSTQRFLQAKYAQLPQFVFAGEVLQASNRLHGPPQDLLQQQYIFLMLEVPGLDTVLHLIVYVADQHVKAYLSLASTWI